MGYGLKRSDLQAMAEAKLQDANILFANKINSGAYYLAGYALEFGLKACISRQIGKEVIPDKSFITKVYIHDLAELVKLAGLERDRRELAAKDHQFDSYWGIAKDWSEQSRYEVKQVADAQYLLEAILNEKHGVMQWIRKHW